MRLLVFGGRDFTSEASVWSFLDWTHSIAPVTTLICGMARGVDTQALNWARSKSIPVREFPANWDRYGGFAGRVRNQQMLREGRPDFAIGFPGGPGTADMLRRVKEAGIAHHQWKEALSA